MNKSLYFTTLFLILVHFTLQGQDFTGSFGRINKGDLIDIPSIAIENNAEAVVLFDVGKSYFQQNGNSFDLFFERTTRIKILSDAGIKWSEIEIPFYKHKNIIEKVYNMEAFSYNEENGIVNRTPLNASNIYEEKVNERWNLKKFAIPNVKEGTVIEYRYKVKSQHIFNLNDWEFQWRIPVVYSEFEVGMVPFYEYSYLLQGSDQLHSYSSYKDNNTRNFGTIDYNNLNHKFVMKDIPAFDNEEFITSINDYVIKIDFQLSKIIKTDGSTQNIMTTWEELNKDLLDHPNFGNYIKRSKKQANKLLDLKDLSSKGEEEKFNHILDFVKKNYSWDNKNNKYASKTVNKFISDKHGNSSDINLFTLGLLQAANIDAQPVVLSTRNHGKIKYDYPYAHFFNYVVILARINDDYILTDATEIFSLNNRIPIRSINDKGLIVQKNKAEWINIETENPSEINAKIQIELVKSNLTRSEISITATEYDALSYRNKYADGNLQQIKEDIENTGYSIIDSTIVVENQLEPKKPYVLSYQQTSISEVINDKIYISPFTDLSTSNNPLKQKERTYPIDLIYPQKRSFNTTLSIPEGFKVDFLPAELSINNQLFELNYNIEVIDATINISFEYYFKASIYSPDHYSAIQAFFEELVKKGNEKVVLSRI